MQGTIDFPILTWITFLPILGIIIILLVPSGKDEAGQELSKKIIRWVAAGITFVQLVLAILIYMFYNPAMAGINELASFQFVEKVSWIHASLPMVGDINIEYFLGIDGISVPMVLLTAIICFVAVFPSFGINKAVKGYFAMYLLLDLGMMGVFCALDFFLFYIFWELMLLPMYFLIGIWGGPRKEYAAIKFFIYTLVGSVFMLLVMIGLYHSVGSFNILDMMNASNFKDGSIFGGMGTTIRYVAFMALFIGFAIKVPMFPFHTWLPDAHVEAPTPISVILAGVLLKMGAYGMIRIAFPIFPDAFGYFQTLIAFLGMVSIVYGALCALGQHKVGKRDFKKLIAYSSVSHMGYVILGLSSMRPEGMTGAIFQMFNHGTITAMLFMIVGVIYDRAHTRGLDDFGGLAKKMPVYTGLMAVAFFAAIGLPGMSGFISEVLIFLGSFNSYPILTMISGLSIVLGAAYMLWALQKIFFGAIPEKWQGPWDPTRTKYKTDDINGLELTALLPLAIIIIFLGIYPNPILNLMTGSVNHFIELMKPFVYIGGHLTGM
ncbi:MAG: NADH-quinone oxidoreductase subunit M [Bacteroidales bacterium]|nr:NADH-quinone oxidoreductase subunit M [Bacteroidales bacterium]